MAFLSVRGKDLKEVKDVLEGLKNVNVSLSVCWLFVFDTQKCSGHCKNMKKEK